MRVWTWLGWLLLWALPAMAQLPLVVQFPEGSALELSAEEVVFDLGLTGYPPPELPAYYAPTEPREPLRVRLFSNLEGGWALEAELEGLWTADGLVGIPPERLEVRLDGGPWLPLADAVVLTVGQGPTGGYREHVLELRLRVHGDEPVGLFQGVLVLSLTRL